MFHSPANEIRKTITETRQRNHEQLIDFVSLPVSSADILESSSQINSQNHILPNKILLL